MEIEDILTLTVSRQDRIWKDITQCSLGVIIDEIRGDQHINRTAFLRTLYSSEKKEYDAQKKHQPGVTFCASFFPDRNTENIQDYNSLMIIDIDKLDDEKLFEVKRQLRVDDNIFCFWESTSGAGIKGLVHLNYLFDIREYGIPAAHKIAFNQLQEHFLKKYQIPLDETGKDVTRLCFISHDKGIVCKLRFSSFKVKKEDYSVLLKSRGVKAQREGVGKSLKTKDDLYNPASRNLPSDRREIKKIIRYLKKKNLSITYSYDQWLRVAFAISRSFTYDVGIKYFMALSELDKDKFDIQQCEKMLKNVYTSSKGEINFGTIIFYAEQKGYKFINKKK